MELENLKAAWQQNNIPSTNINNEQLKEMMNNANNTAMKKLIKWEKISLKILYICSPLCLLMFMNDERYRDFVLFLTILSVVLFTLTISWSHYKIRYLKNIKLLNMNITELSKRIATYKQYLYYELLISAPFALLWVSIIIYCNANDSSNLITGYVLGIIWYGSFALMGILFYKHKYLKNIKKIQQILDEAKEFEEQP